MGGELFRARGLSIVENNWLEIYAPYEKWVDAVLPDLKEGDIFEPTVIEIQEG
jgi:DNA topoisomerase III